MGYKRKELENMEGLLTNGRKKFVKYDEGAAMFSMGIHSFGSCKGSKSRISH